MSQIEELATLDIIIYARREDDDYIADFIDIFLKYIRDNCSIPVSSLNITQPSYNTFIYISIPCIECKKFDTKTCTPTKINELNAMNLKTDLEKRFRAYLSDKGVKNNTRSVGCKISP